MSNTRKLFVSQPMRGKTDDEIKDVRKAAVETAEELFGEKYDLIDSFFENAPVDTKPLWYLGESLKLLSAADLVIFVPGWQDARGCRIEKICAEEYGIPFIAISFEKKE